MSSNRTLSHNTDTQKDIASNSIGVTPKTLSDDEDLLVVLIVGNNFSVHNLILDSISFSHYTTHKEWFQSYKLCDVGSIVLGDNYTCKVTGIGII